MAARLSAILQADEAPQVPLVVDIGEMKVAMEKVLRYLPGRRIVGRGQWSNQPVIFKLFGSTARARHEYYLECRRLDGLHERGIPAPSRVMAKQANEGSLLVLEWLEGDTASALLEKAPHMETGLALMTEIFVFVQNMHTRGCLQTDVHLDNFMRRDGSWHVLDAGSCRVSSSLGRGRRLRNLAALLAQFPPEYPPPLAKLLQDSDIGEKALSRKLHKSRIRRYQHMLDKTDRNCTEFAEINFDELRGMIRREYRNTLKIHTVKQANDLVFKGEPIKRGNSATVVALDDPEWVVKRYNMKSLARAFKSTLKGSRAHKSWRAGHFLRLISVRTPRPIAFFEERSGGIVRSAWIITERVSGKPIDRYRDKLDDAIMDEIRRLFSLMLEFRVSHGDMKASNFINQDGTLWLVDLDAVRLHKTKWAARFFLKRDARRFLRNWPEDSPARKAIEKQIAPVIF